MTIDSADDSKISNRTIRIESRIGRTIRNRIESRSFAGPYFIHVLLSRAYLSELARLSCKASNVLANIRSFTRKSS